MTAPNAFNLLDPLPVGTTTLIEASAGTGKTFTLAALTVRFVAEQDVPISQILLVTFTKAAAAELRDRIREALIAAEAQLRDPSPTGDMVLTQIAAVTDEERAVRHSRIERAIRDFDSSMISTIHGFCSSVLSSQGVLTDQISGSTAVASEATIVRQVCADALFSAASSADDDAELPAIGDLQSAVLKVRNLGECEVTAESEQASDLLLADLVRRSNDEVTRRLKIAGAVTYTSMVASVRDLTRSDPQSLAGLRQRFRVALIDEFQDTDPIQWEIFQEVFGKGEPRPTLILVGDPKQAIYGFRGGDVYTYLEARGRVEPRVLLTNYRSVPQAVNAMNSIGAHQFFGEEHIAYQPVQIAAANRGRRLLIEAADPQEAPGLQVRCLEGFRSFREFDSPQKKIAVEKYRRRIAEDLADQAVELLNKGVLVDDAKDGGATRRVGPADIAVLVGSSAAADPVAKALARRGISSVKLIKDSVLISDAADQWLTLLRAMERPADQRRAGAAALTWFFGWTAEALAGAADPRSQAAAHELTEVQYQLASWAETLELHGVSALFAEIRRTSGVIPRLLSGWQGERNLTDLEHVAELIHAESSHRSGGLTAAQALEVLDDWMLDAADEDAAEAMQRRVESDDDSVRILTIHTAKGLEFPVVLLPDLAGGGNRVKAVGELSFFDSEAGRRVLDVSTPQSASGETKAKSRSAVAPRATGETKRQNCGDQHRLTYVALTRASHLTITWWAPLGGCELTGLARLLFGTGEDPSSDVAVKIPPVEETAAQLRVRLDSVGAQDSIQVSTVPPEPANPIRFDLHGSAGVDSTASHEADVSVATAQGRTSRIDPSASATQLRVATLDRELARSASRWSFSSLKNNVRVFTPGASSGSGATISSAPMSGPSRTVSLTDPSVENSDDRGAGDELGMEQPRRWAAANTDGESPAPLNQNWSTSTLFDGLGAGAEFGSMVHELYEVVDFATPDPVGAFSAALREESHFAVTPDQQERLPHALAQTLLTSLGGQFGDIRLADLGANDRLNELDFYIPIAPGGSLGAERIGHIVAEHLEADHPLRPWAEQLSLGLGHVDLTGYMSGSIDLVFRYPVKGQIRYSVLDYKTNLLSGGDLHTVGDYHPDRLASAMEHHQYVLQALIYSVALHRYLRLRLPGYDPARHIGPVAYVFLRGMVGVGTPVAESGYWAGSPAGVFTWPIPPSLVEDLSDAFDHGLQPEVTR